MDCFRFLSFILFLSGIQSVAQETNIRWDNTTDKKWPVGFRKVSITSSFDQSIQNAIFFAAPAPESRPLIVSLHTWSGNYLQEDPLAEEVFLRGWNYIHPDFRGPNNNPDACGSDPAIQDIEDAIQFAIQNGNVDRKEVHIVGASGGGYATLLSFMTLDFSVKSFNAWVPVSNLEEWYFECKDRNLKYAVDLEKVTTGGREFDPVEARKRSPLFMKFPAEKRKNSSLRIYTGIHDGYTGSVPVTHSINMFNKLLSEMHPDKPDQLVSDSLKLLLAEKQMNPAGTLGKIGGREIHLQRWLPGISLTIFEGGHEMLVLQALALLQVGEQDLQATNILTIGDSNGAAENGWPAQLRKLLPFSTIINKSVSGNTIGFDNLDQEKLNTLKNINRYLDEASAELPSGRQFDMVILGLGTNDAKKIFEGQQNKVADNLRNLIDKTIGWFEKSGMKKPEIFIVSPPPLEEHKADQVKYGGGNQRINKYKIKFRKITREYNSVFIDIHARLKRIEPDFTTDGVHLTKKAQFELAQMITEAL